MKATAPGSRRIRRFSIRLRRLAAAALLGLAGCATPVGVEHLPATEVHRQLTSNVVSSGSPSQFSANVLRAHALDEVAERDPAAAIAALHLKALAAEAAPQDLFALAELAFQHAENGGGRPYHLAATLYAYAYLFPGPERAQPNGFDPRFRWAAEIYNLALSRAFRSADGGSFIAEGGARELPFGTLAVAFDEADLVVDGRRLTELTPVAELSVRGLRNRYRQAGLGTPLAASGVPLRPELGFQVGERVRTNVTALLRFDDAATLLASGRGHARLELLPATKTLTATVQGRDVPLEIEPSASLAYGLSAPELWDLELHGFFRGTMLRDRPTRLGAIRPYVPGRIPVVFVHGTVSSAGRWADMVNDLISDVRIRERFQFWFFQYETGNPIPYSALLLRDALREAVRKIDPDGRDAALRQMVVIGHSQGGLLTKLTAVDSGERFLAEVTERPLDALDLSPETRDLLRRTLVVEPLPFVRRVVFMATPHGGSHIAGRPLAQLVAGLLRLPVNIGRAAVELAQSKDAKMLAPDRPRFGSVYGMAPGSRLVRALSGTPLAPGVLAHSIIAVEGDGPLEDGDDGVVSYASARIDGVASELVVRSGHSCQAHPAVIAEVRRILLLHAAQVPRPGEPAELIAGMSAGSPPSTTGTGR